jgi:hypothetical protein
MNDELERIWMEAMLAKFKVLSQNLPVVTGKSQKPQSGSRLVSRPRFEMLF